MPLHRVAGAPDHSTFSTDGQCSTASSTAGLSGMEDPRRNCPSLVMTTFACASSMRLRRASAEKAAEDHRVRRSDPRAGQHGHDRLRDHRHVDGHPVAGRHPQAGRARWPPARPAAAVARR